METKKRHPDKADPELNELRQGPPVDPFPLGVYPVFDDDLPRDSAYENFSAPDLRDMHPYPRGLE